jgi:nucleotide-binding universal stress UspA family protein
MAVPGIIGRTGRLGSALLDGGVAICVDQSVPSRSVVSQALAVAGSLGAQATLLHVVEPERSGRQRADPVEWEILRCEARENLQKYSGLCADAGHSVGAEMVEGSAAEQICRWARNHETDLLVLGIGGKGDLVERRMGNTARDVIDRTSASILLVPSTMTDADPVRYRRILVPLDGSSVAESVLPLAARIADAHDAELLLAHVAPIPELTQIGPAEVEDIELLERLVKRNERTGRRYLDRLKTRIARLGIDVSATVLSGDVRHRLADLASEDGVDLIVLAARGQSNRRDVRYGSIASYLMTRVAVPLLLVQPRALASMLGLPADFTSSKARLPSRAIS